MSSDHLPAVTTSSVPTRHFEGGASWESATTSYLAAAVDSENTERAYRRHLRAFAAHEHQLERGDGEVVQLPPIHQLADVTPAHLLSWRIYITRECELAPASQAQALAALRGFLRWAGSMGLHGMNGDTYREALRTPRISTRRPYDVLTDQQARQLLAAASSSRDRAVLAVMLGGGLRAAEVVGLDVSHLRQLEGGMVLYVEQGKGRKDRTVPLADDVEQLLLEHLDSAGMVLGDHGSPLFSRDDRAGSGGRLTTRSVQGIVRRTASHAGIMGKRCSPHTLRHTYAIRALRAGASEPAIGKLLGHSENSTATRRYVDHLELDELRAVVPALPVLEIPRAAGWPA